MTSTRLVVSPGTARGATTCDLAVLEHDAVELRHVLGLAPEVELLVDVRFEVLHDADGGGQLAARRERHRTWPRARRMRRSALDDGVDLRALHLDDHVLSVEQAGGVYLGDRRRRERLRVDPREHLVRIAPQLGPQDALHVGVLERAHAIEALAKLAAVRLREEALARRDQLAELDVRGPQVLEGAAHDGRSHVALAAESRPEHRRRGLRADPRGAREPAHGARREDRRHAERTDGHPDGERAPRELRRASATGSGAVIAVVGVHASQRKKRAMASSLTPTRARCPAGRAAPQTPQHESRRRVAGTTDTSPWAPVSEALAHARDT